MKTRIATAIAAACVLLSNVAFADETRTYVESQTGKDQNVTFLDDPLAAGGLTPLDPRIMVISSPKRVMLLRPRTQFVMEMLKSVESL